MPNPTHRPEVELTAPGEVTTLCRKCGHPIKVRFGDLSREDAAKAIAQLDRIPQECPGFHCELGGWRHFWRLDEALDLLYPQEVAVA